MRNNKAVGSIYIEEEGRRYWGVVKSYNGAVEKGDI